MDTTNLLDIAYSVSGIVMALFYIPQIKLVIKSQSNLKEVSLVTWGVWALCVFISFLYGLLVLKDFKFALLSLISSICCSIIFSITAIMRIKYKENSDVILNKVTLN